MTVIYTIALCLLFIVVTVTYMSVAAFESKEAPCRGAERAAFARIFFLVKLRIIVVIWVGFV
jgi:hypothetical protein